MKIDSKKRPMSLPYRIGSVPYLNAAPLRFSLEQRKPASDVPFTIGREIPSKLSRMMKDGELDVAMMPLADYCAGVGECLVPDVSISCIGEVASVLLFTKCPICKVETIACDVASKSSVALMNVLLRERWQWTGTTVPLKTSQDFRAIPDECDAALLIGDVALQFSQETDTQRYDLGEEWYRLTGLPFVFAAWVMAKREGMAPLARLLRDAKREGLSRLTDVVEQNVGVASLDRDAVFRYLTENVNFDFTPAHIQGVMEFQRLSLKHNLLLKQQRDLNFIAL